MKIKLTALVLATGALCSSFACAEEAKASYTLIKNVNIFDGKNEKLSNGSSVLIENNLIKSVGKGLKAPEGATVIDGGGRTLIPGLIDMHSHLAIHQGMLDGRDGFDQMAIGALTQERMHSYLDQGFTSARDLGGNVLGVSKARRLGRISGPKIFPCGAFISQTGGHGDTGRFNDYIGEKDYLEKNGFSYIVDGVPEVLKAARQNLRAGATQLKIMGGGGVASEFDPLHTVQFSLEEMKAAVSVANDYGTYVCVHAYHDASVNRAIDAGVRCIEHNFLTTEKTIKRMKKEGIALSCQAVMSLEAFANPESITFFSADQKAKGKRVNAGATQMFDWAVKHDLLMVTGGDMFGVADGPRQAANMTKMKDVGVTPFKILKMGTSDAATVISWSGEMNPYKDGAIGVIKPGAYADLVVIEGNPLENIDILLDYKNNMKVIITDGKVWKNTL